MKYICVQPAQAYFAWQIDTMLHNFRTVGIQPEDIHVVCSNNDGIHDHFIRMMEKYPRVTFTFYQDTREYTGYIASIKHHLIAKHLKAFPMLQHEPLFFHDCDIVFTKRIDFEPLLQDDIWYTSDTCGYLGYDYVLGKGRDVLEMMLDIAGVQEDVFRCNQRSSGGAQYILKNATPDMFIEMEEMSHVMYKKISALSHEKKKKDPDYFPIQIWTAEMWAFLFVAWKRSKLTTCHKALDFCWATDKGKRWHEVSIYHNAGVTTKSDQHFYKAAYYHNFPPLDLVIKPEYCSYYYYNLVKNALT